LRAFVRQAAGKKGGRIVERFCAHSFRKYFYNSSTTIPCRPCLSRVRKIFQKNFYNFSTILPCVEEFGASGLAWRTIVEGIIVEKLWKHLVNAVPGFWHRGWKWFCSHFGETFPTLILNFTILYCSSGGKAWRECSNQLYF
jgi:hypothetical protein